MDAAVAAAVLLTGCGLALAWAGAIRYRPASGPDVEGYLRSLDTAPEEDLDPYQRRLREPLVARLLRPLGRAAGSGIAGVTPRAQLDRIHRQLLQAGLAGNVRAEELAAVQVLLGVGTALVGFVLAVLLRPALPMATILVVILPLIALALPQVWLDRRVRARKDAIRADLPDALDLLSIAVEAGTGFEGAMAVVCENFATPLGVELSRLLREMELGLSRREALQNLRNRTEVAELNGFVVALVQADALGMPIGRVLKAQAAEMRLKRRAWAREKAAKLPVKILMPLVLFIFPAILVITLGPAASSVYRSFG